MTFPKWHVALSFNNFKSFVTKGNVCNLTWISTFIRLNDYFYPDHIWFCPLNWELSIQRPFFPLHSMKVNKLVTTNIKWNKSLWKISCYVFCSFLKRCLYGYRNGVLTQLISYFLGVNLIVTFALNIRHIPLYFWDQKSRPCTHSTNPRIMVASWTFQFFWVTPE